MIIGVIRFPGTNNEHETIRALNSFDTQSILIEHFEVDRIHEADGIWIPGGFSYGDVLRAGALAAKSDIIREIAQSGHPILGPCNGFQILVEAHLLPGALLPNHTTRFVCKWIHMTLHQPQSQPAPDTTLRLPIAHFEGNLFLENPEIIQPNIYAYYTNSEGEATESANPNGSIHNIAGLISDDRRIIGLMPHPERAVFKFQGSTDGRQIIDQFLQEVKR